MRQRKRKRAVTLIEIMIVIVLIGLIGGALAYNMRGSLDKGRIFKTEQNCQRVHAILTMECAQQGLAIDTVLQSEGKVEELLNQSPLVNKGADLLVDAWGERLQLQIDPDSGELKVFSKRVEQLTQSSTR